ncbi:hypothetical protein SprV_0401445300 [Sparganum proliferum]
MFTNDGFYLEPRQHEDLSFSKISDEQGGDLRGCPVRSEQLPHGTYQCLHSDPTDYPPAATQPTPLLPVYMSTGDAAALPTSTPYPTGWNFDKAVGGSCTNVPQTWNQAGAVCSDCVGTSNHDYLSTDMTQGCGYLQGFLDYSSQFTPEQVTWPDLSRVPFQPSPALLQQQRQQQQQSVGNADTVVLPQGPSKPSTGARTGKTAFPFTVGGSELMLCPGFPQACVGEYQGDAETKPPFSYITLIASAIMSAKDQRATLIVPIPRPYSWQNSIRHALSFNDCFTRVPRPSGETGKGSYWTLHSGALSMFENGSSIRRNRKFVDETRVRRTCGAGVVRSSAGGKFATPVAEGTAFNELAAISKVGLEDSTEASGHTFSRTKADSSPFDQDMPVLPESGSAIYSAIITPVTNVPDLQMN